VIVRGIAHPSGTGRLFGYRADRVENHTQAPMRDHPDVASMADTTVPELIDQSQFGGRPFDQNQCGSCGGHGKAKLDRIALLMTGAYPFALTEDPSPGHGYGVARGIERAADPTADPASTPLTDSGVEPFDLITVNARYGMRRMRATSAPDGSYSDVWPANVNDEPLEGDLDTAQGGLLTGEYRLDPSASDTILTLRKTLLLAPVGIGVFVASLTMNFAAGSAPVVAENTSDPNGGGHWITVCGARPSVAAAGEYDFLILNSWSEDNYGVAPPSGSARGGYFWARESFVRSASDLIAWTVRRAA
jgi:hypothetical protein